MTQPNNIPCMWIERNPRGKFDLCSSNPNHPIIQECDSFDHATLVMDDIIQGKRIIQ